MIKDEVIKQFAKTFAYRSMAHRTHNIIEDQMKKQDCSSLRLYFPDKLELEDLEIGLREFEKEVLLVIKRHIASMENRAVTRTEKRNARIVRVEMKKLFDKMERL